MNTKAAVPSVEVKAQAPKVEKTKSKAKVAKPNKAWAESYRPGTIGRQIAEMILKGDLDNEAILAKVKKDNKTAKTTYGCIAWYKSAGRKAGAVK